MIMLIINQCIRTRKRAWQHATGEQPIRSMIFAYRRIYANIAQRKSHVVLSQLYTVAQLKITQNPLVLKCLLKTRQKNPIQKSQIVNTSIQTGKVNLSVFLNRAPSQSPSLSSNSDIEVITPKKLQPKTNASKKLKTIISFRHQFKGLSCTLVKTRLSPRIAEL